MIRASDPRRPPDVPVPLLRHVLDAEAASLSRPDHLWHPATLVSDYQSLAQLKDMARRHALLEEAAKELQQLDRADRYIKQLKIMGLRLRHALIVRRTDQSEFLQAVGRFYESYGDVLRWLYLDNMRGKLG